MNAMRRDKIPKSDIAQQSKQIFISRKVALGSKTEIRAATRCFRFSPDCVEKSPFSLMTENSQDRWCVSFAAR
jgi:hypothetical protein